MVPVLNSKMGADALGRPVGRAEGPAQSERLPGPMSICCSGKSCTQWRETTTTRTNNNNSQPVALFPTAKGTPRLIDSLGGLALFARPTIRSGERPLVGGRLFGALSGAPEEPPGCSPLDPLAPLVHGAPAELRQNLSRTPAELQRNSSGKARLPLGEKSAASSPRGLIVSISEQVIQMRDRSISRRLLASF